MSPSLEYTPIEEIPWYEHLASIFIVSSSDNNVQVQERARRAFATGKTRSVAFRKEQIAKVAHMIKDNEARFKAALKADLNRHGLMFDIGSVYKDVRYTFDNLDKWAASQAVDFNMGYYPLSPSMKSEPKGVVLIISPFNVPIYLSLSPLVNAIAAGDAVVIKPSESDVNFCRLLAELLPQYLDSELYHVVLGGIPETSRILELRWDHIMYIGGGFVGRIVAQAAAKHLTPVTLELGGKNVVVVDPKVDVKMAARRILWGRTQNAGQVCTSPEYVLVPRQFQATLVAALKDTWHEFYPEGPRKSESFARIVTQAHAARIKKLLDNTKGTIVCGGETDVEAKYIAPTIVDNIKGDDILMEDEIFGPVLLIYPVADVDEAISIVQSREKPLVVSCFSPDKKFLEKVFSNTASGAALANETFLHPAVPGFGIGGVGASGYGYYSGKFGFDEFSHVRVTLNTPKWADKFVMWLRFPPYKQRYEDYRSSINIIYPFENLPPRSGAPQTNWAFWSTSVLAFVGASSFLLARYPAVLQNLLKAD